MDTDTWGEVSLMGDVCDFYITSLFRFGHVGIFMRFISDSLIYIRYMSLLRLLARQPLGLVEDLSELPPVCQLQLRSEDVALLL